MATLGPFTNILVPAEKHDATNGTLYFAKDTSPLFDTAIFSRPNVDATSGATVFRNGQLIELAENEPDWDDSSGCPVLKMRPQEEGLFLKTDDISAPQWDIGENTISSNSNLDPFGDLRADKIIPNTNNVRHDAAQAITKAASALDYSLVSYLKTDGIRQYVIIGLRGGSLTNRSFLTIDLFNGTIITNDTNGFTHIKSKVTLLSSGYCEIKLVCKTLTDTNLACWLIPSNGPGNILSGDAVYAGNATDGIIHGGTQVVQSSDYVDYIRNPSTSTLTRSANSFEFTDLVTKGVLGTNEGSILFHFEEPLFKYNTDLLNVLFISDGIDNTKYLRFRGNSSNTVFQVIGYGNIISATLDNTQSAFIISWKDKKVEIFDQNGVANSSIQTLDIDIKAINKWGSTTMVSIIPIGFKKIAASPISLTEAQAIAYLASL